MRGTLVSAIAPLMLLSGCNDAAHGDAAKSAGSDPDEVLSAVHEVENTQLDALARRDLRGATNLYTADARFYAPGSAMAFGREDIQASFQSMLDDDAYEVLIDSGSRQNWVAASGDLVATGFTGRVTRTIDGKVVTSPFVNRTVWQKQPDGSWQITSDVNAIVPKPPK